MTIKTSMAVGNTVDSYQKKTPFHSLLDTYKNNRPSTVESLTNNPAFFLYFYLNNHGYLNVAKHDPYVSLTS